MRVVSEGYPPHETVALSIDPCEVIGPNSNVFKQENSLNRVWLWIAFISVTMSLAIGSMFLAECDCGRLLCPFLIAQGACGLPILVVHVLTLTFR